MHVAIIAATAALGSLLFGYDTGVISGALLLRAAFCLSSLMAGVVTSIALAGAADRAAVAQRLADRFGGCLILLRTAAVFVLDVSMSALTSSLVMLHPGLGAGRHWRRVHADATLPCRDRAGVGARLWLRHQRAVSMDGRHGRGTLVPETKGLSLEAIEALWLGRAGGKKPAIVPGKGA